jgi:histidyl-tRNA synthetase
MARPASLSGFPEWLPEERIVEQHVLDTLRRTFELWGISSIETRAVEPLEQLLSKGEIDKEVYVVRRLHADPGEETADQAADGRQLALHFDLTVPLARYVLENAGRLQFPFRRYQIQRAWRGERPQEGRFREFVQADVDVVGDGELPFHYEVELPLVMADALGALRDIGLPAFTIQVNNRKVAEGFYRGLGLADPVGVLRIVDKLDKIGAAAVARALREQEGADERQAQACLDLAAIRTPDASFVERVRALGVEHPVLDDGLAELARVVEAATEHAPGVLVADLRIARGLDYYTGTVYETVLDGHPDLGSICSGGRYDALVSDGRTTYPGVGLSIGVSRLVSRLLRDGLTRATRRVPSCVLVAVPDEKRRAECDRVAGRLRRRGIPVEVAPSAAKYGRQIRHADRRGIPFVWFPGEDGPDAQDQVKDIRSGDQADADADSWQPPEQDRWPRVVPG